MKTKKIICLSKIEDFKSIYAKNREVKKENQKQYKNWQHNKLKTV